MRWAGARSCMSEGWLQQGKEGGCEKGTTEDKDRLGDYYNTSHSTNGGLREGSGGKQGKELCLVRRKVT